METKIFRKIGKGLGEYFLGTETKKFFKEKGRSYTVELITGKYIPNIWSVGVIAGSVYSRDPRVLESLLFPEALRLVSMMKIPEDKEQVEEAEFYRWLSKEIKETIPEIEKCSKSLKEASEVVRRTRKNKKDNIEGYLESLNNF